MALEMSFGDFDLQKVETWPWPVKALACLIVFVLVIAGGWYFAHDDQMATISNLENKEQALRNEFTTKAREAANLNDYKDQIAELESLLEAQLRQLPDSNEVANLLDDISFIAQDNGLNLVSIRWESEVKKDIYTELPMSIVVTGTYEQLGSFAADTAALPRIVTIDRFNLERVKTAKQATNSADEDLLEMKLLAKTFRYNQEEAQKAADRKARRAQRGR